MGKNVLIFGCGKIGAALAQELLKTECRVTGVRRSAPDEENKSFRTIAADITQATSLHKLDQDYDLVIIIIAPETRTSQNYQDIYENGVTNLICYFKQFGSHTPCIFVSSSSVYGQNRGEWIDEESETMPESYNGQYLLKAEESILEFHPQSVIVRFSGIYGPGRNRLIRQLVPTCEIQADPPFYTNRIHQDDCVGVLSLICSNALRKTAMAPIYLASDNLPVSKWELMCWLANETDKPEPTPLRANNQAPQNKRCDNYRLRELGYRFKYPNYMSGYSAMLK